MSDNDELRQEVLTVADRLFYGRGYQTVGMDQLRSEAGISLKKLYSLFPSKDSIILAVLKHRNEVWTDGISRQAAKAVTDREKLLAVYDFLGGWFNQDDFRGCAFINSFGELGAVAPEVAQAARDHKTGFQDYVNQVVAEAGGPSYLGPQLALLAEGAQTTAAICGGSAAAAQARAAAEVLIDAAFAAAPNNAAPNTAAPNIAAPNTAAPNNKEN